MSTLLPALLIPRACGFFLREQVYVSFCLKMVQSFMGLAFLPRFLKKFFKITLLRFTLSIVKVTILQFSEFLVNLPSCTTITIIKFYSISSPHKDLCTFAVIPYSHSSPRELLIYILSLKMKWSFLDILCKLNPVICMWLLWFSILCLSFIHVVACISLLFLVTGE